jgi:hypothetical protein
MSADHIDNSTPPAQEQTAEREENRPSLLTPARRAALEALEREFHDLLQAAAH